MATHATVIEIYDTDGDSVYTSGSAIVDALACSVKQVLTTKPGSFNFTLPAIKGLTKSYDDIGMYYTVKIYMGEAPLDSSDLLMVGKILKISSGGSTQNGILRHFEGKDLGEKAERIFKKNKRYLEPVYANTVATVLADELDSYNGSKMDTDETPVTITSRTEPYWDTFRKLSDYYYDGSTKVQKDFYFDTAGDFVWKNRPFRTSSVEALAYGSATNNRTFQDYELIYDLLPSKNSITVYGAPTATLPNVKTEYTDSLTNWAIASSPSSSTGTALSLDDTYLTPPDGTYNILCTCPDTSSPYNQTFTFKRTLGRLTLRTLNKLKFYYYPGRSNPAMSYTDMTVQLNCPDDSNCYTHTLTGAPDTLHWKDIELGDQNVYDASENPSGQWVKTGNPDWWDIESVQFHGESSGESGSLLFLVNKMYFSPERWEGSATDSTNVSLYGLREAEYTDENLLSNGECAKRASSLLMQLKEKTIGLNCTLSFNSNVLLGDRCPVTIAHENLSSLNMDVVAVENSQVGNAYTTKPSLIYSSDIRVFPPTSPAEALNRQVQNLKSVTSEIYSRVVR